MNGIRSSGRASAWVVGAIILGVLCIASTVAIGRAAGSSALLGAAVALVGVSASTGVAYRWLYARANPRPQRRRRVIIVGAGPAAEHLAAQAESKGYHVLGFVEDLDPAARLDWPQHVLAPREALPELAEYLKADQVLVADSPRRIWDLVEKIEQAELETDVFVVPDMYEIALCRPTSVRVGDVPLYRVPRRRVSPGYLTTKRVMDVAGSILILGLTAPFLALAALAIRLSSRGPVLFRQERVGKNGQAFEIVKFRTMVIDAEKDGPKFCAGSDDPRLTTIGKFLRQTHLDEVPQLWNVLRGEMSLVGPRPERPVFVEQFQKELPRYGERHRIQPGITGLAQINGYYHSSPREKLRFDLMYVYHPSVWLDLTIIARTFLTMFH
jgi:exopolysaccharide biosynthesis polyprenyl glycosylphosphotransferase